MTRFATSFLLVGALVPGVAGVVAAAALNLAVCLPCGVWYAGACRRFRTAREVDT